MNKQEKEKDKAHYSFDYQTMDAKMKQLENKMESFERLDSLVSIRKLQNEIKAEQNKIQVIFVFFFTYLPESNFFVFVFLLFKCIIQILVCFL